MINIASAIDYVLHLEDSRMSGNVTSTPGDTGGLTRYGIACHSHPELLKLGYFSSGLPNGKALTIARDVYTKDYVAPLMLDHLSSQLIANYVLSAAVNDGVEQATKLLQRAINTLMPNALKVDGVPGPFTISAANRCMEVSLLACLRLEQIRFHVSLKDPKELLGWINRDLS